MSGEGSCNKQPWKKSKPEKSIVSAEAEDDAFISVFISAERSDVSENPAERTFGCV